MLGSSFFWFISLQCWWKFFFFKSYFLFMVAVTRPKFSLDYIYFVVNKLKILRFCLLCFY